MAQIAITRKDLEQKVQDGWKKTALAEHYGLPMLQMTAVLKQASLKIRKFHEPKFILVDDEDETSLVEDTIEDATVNLIEVDVENITSVVEHAVEPDNIEEGLTEPAQVPSSNWN